MIHLTAILGAALVCGGFFLWLSGLLFGRRTAPDDTGEEVKRKLAAEIGAAREAAARSESAAKEAEKEAARLESELGGLKFELNRAKAELDEARTDSARARDEAQRAKAADLERARQDKARARVIPVVGAQSGTGGGSIPPPAPKVQKSSGPVAASPRRRGKFQTVSIAMRDQPGGGGGDEGDVGAEYSRILSELDPEDKS